MIDELRDILGCTCSYNEAYDGKSWNLKTEEYEDCECLAKLPAIYEIGLGAIGGAGKYDIPEEAGGLNQHAQGYNQACDDVIASQRKAWAKACGVKR